MSLYIQIHLIVGKLDSMNGVIAHSNCSHKGGDVHG